MRNKNTQWLKRWSVLFEWTLAIGSIGYIASLLWYFWMRG